MTTNNFWVLYPQFKKMATTVDKKLTIQSNVKVEFKCTHCKNKFKESPKNLLETGFCPDCNRYLMEVDKKVLFKKTISMICQTDDYHDYEKLVKSHNFSSSQLGFIQEIFAKFYFEIHTNLYNVEQFISYAWKPDKATLEKIGMPTRDLGTDAVIIHKNGQVSLVQVKWRSKSCVHGRTVFNGMSIDGLGIKNLKHLYLFSNAVGSSMNKKEPFKFILNDKLLDIDWNVFKLNVQHYSIESKPTVLKYVVPPKRLWQKQAHKFSKRKELVSICAAPGSGKTSFSFFECQSKNGFFLVVVPSLQLLSQWFYSFVMKGKKADYLLVGSQVEDNDFDVPYSLTTDSDTIENFLLETGDTMICMSTYHSLQLVYDACKNTGTEFDYGFIDEAHCTAGNSSFSLVTKSKFKIEKRYYLTATPKVYKGQKKEKMISMDDEKIYGQQFHYSCRSAIQDGILCDYKILLGMGQSLEEGYPSSLKLELNAKFLAICIEKYGIQKILVASSSHESSRLFYKQFKKIYNGPLKLVLMKKNAKAQDKSIALNKMADGPCIIFNVRVFNLGTDMPSLEGVFLNGDKKSTIDIVQTLCRCLRSYIGKKLSYMMVPAFCGEDLDVEEGDYPTVRNVLLAMGNSDTALMEEITCKSSEAMAGRGRACKRVEIVGVGDYDISSIGIRLFDRFGNSLGMSHLVKFNMLYKEILKNGGWVPSSFVKDGVKLGVFQTNLKGSLSGRNQQFKKDIDDFRNKLEELPFWDEMYKDLEEIIENRKKKSYTSKEKFDMLYNEIVKNGGWVPSSFVKDGVNLGDFQNNLKGSLSGGNQRFKNDIDDFRKKLEELPFWNEMKGDIDKMIENRKKKSYTPKEKFEMLYKEIVKNKGWVAYSFENDGVKLGIFQDSLKCTLSGNNQYYKKDIGYMRKKLEELPFWNDMKGNLDEIIENRKKKSYTPKEKFEMLYNEIKKNKGWVPRKFVKDGVNLGDFQNNLKGPLSGGNQRFKKDIDYMRKKLEELPFWDEMKGDLEEMIENRKKKSYTPKETFVMLYNEIVKNGGWIHSKFVKDEVNLGKFQSKLKGALSGGNQYYKKDIGYMRKKLEELPFWDEMYTQMMENKKN